jgi:hypothetical protein
MKQFLYIFLLAVVTAGCSDNQATVEEESNTTVVREKPADDLQSNTIERGINDVDVDTIGMAEFLALKATEAAKYREENDLTDENDINVDTTGFTEFKSSKAKTARRPCDCADSIIAERKKYNNSRNSTASTTERSTQQSESRDEAESSDQAQVAEESTPVSGESTDTVKEKAWSNKAKGAVIGAATGAAAGAVINKQNRAVGGVVGAATGYGIGRHKDKKDTVGKEEETKDTTDQQQ